MSRFRSEVLENVNHDNSFQEHYTNGRGTCTKEPGTPLYIYPAALSTSLQKYSYREMTDEEIPDYHKLSAQGLIFNNPMQSTSVVEERSPVTYNYTRCTEKYGCTPPKWYGYINYQGAGNIDFSEKLWEHSIDMYLPSGLDPDDVSLCCERAVSKSWANVTQADMLSYVALIEAGKTLGGMKQLLGTAHKVIRAGRKKIHRLQKSGSSLSRTDLADFYMNLRYNLRPLYYDIRGLQKAIEPDGNHSRRTYRGVSSMSGTKDDMVSVPWMYYSAPYIDVDVDFHRYCKTEIEARAGVLVDWKGDSLSAKLGGWSFASSAWDLVPFSFIVDWFFNVGDTLLAWMPIVGGKALTSWVSSTVTTTQTSMIGLTHCDISSTSPSYRYSLGNFDFAGEFTKTTIEKVRVPRPERTVIPNISVSLDALKLLDLGVIVRNLFNEKNTIRKYRL
jgi:hypothetical protein